MHLKPLLEQLYVVDKDGMSIPFKLNWAQEKFLEVFEEQWNAGKPVRIIVLKARQLGISTLVQAIIFLLTLNIKHQRSVVIGSEVDNAQHLLGMSHHYWETYPYAKLHAQKYGSRNELAWSDTGGSIKVMTSGNAKAGRGKTTRALHASEVAFYENPRKVMLGMLQSVPTRPGTFVCMESTANGLGDYFCDRWEAAEGGDSDYIPLFFPWDQHYEYRASYIGVPFDNLGDLDAEEKLLRRRGLDDDQLAWRRWAIRNLTDNDIHQFHQEYPLTPEEAFVSTGSNVFPIAKLRECYEPEEGMKGRLYYENGVQFQPDINGPLTIFRWPSPDTEYGKYLIGGDPTHTTRGDSASGQVISRRTLEQVAVLDLRIDPGGFGRQLDLLGQFYNNAIVAPEVEGPGYATVATMIEKNYPNLWENKVADTTPGKHSDHWGWRTTAKSKQLAIGYALRLVVDHDVTIHHSKTFSEMKNYVTLENGGYGNASGTPNDDTVMAYAIALTAHMLEPPLMAYGMDDMPAASVPWEEWAELEAGIAETY